MEHEGAVTPCDILVIDPSYGEAEYPQHHQQPCVNRGARKARPLSNDKPDWDTVSISAIVELEMMKEDIEHELVEQLQKFGRLLNLEAKHDGRENGSLAQEVSELASILEDELEEAEHEDDGTYVKSPMSDPNELYDYWQISSDHLFWSPPSPSLHEMDDTMVVCTVPRRVISQCPILDSIQEEDEYDAEVDDDSDDDSDDSIGNELMGKQKIPGSVKPCLDHYETLPAPENKEESDEKEDGNKKESEEEEETTSLCSVQLTSSGIHSTQNTASETDLFAGMLASVIISDALKQYSENALEAARENSTVALQARESLSSGSSVTIYEKNETACASQSDLLHASETNAAFPASSNNGIAISELSMSKETVAIQPSDGIVNISDRQLTSSESVSGSGAKMLVPAGSKCCVSVVLTSSSNRGRDEPGPHLAKGKINSTPASIRSTEGSCTIVGENEQNETMSAPALLSHQVHILDSECTHSTTNAHSTDKKTESDTFKSAIEGEIGCDASNHATPAASKSNLNKDSDFSMVSDSKSGEVVYISPISSTNTPTPTDLPTTPTEQTVSTEKPIATDTGSELQTACTEKDSKAETVCEIKELITEVVNLRAGSGTTKLAKKEAEKHSQKEICCYSESNAECVTERDSKSKTGPASSNCGAASYPCIKGPARNKANFDDLQKKCNTETEGCVEDSHAHATDYTTEKLSGTGSQSPASQDYRSGRPKTRYGAQLQNTMCKGLSESSVATYTSRGMDLNSCTCSVTHTTNGNLQDKVVETEFDKCRENSDSIHYVHPGRAETLEHNTHGRKESISGEMSSLVQSTAKKGPLLPKLSTEKSTLCAVIKGSSGSVASSSAAKYRQALCKGKGSFEGSILPSRLKRFSASVPSPKRGGKFSTAGHRKVCSSDALCTTPETKSTSEMAAATVSKKCSAGSQISGANIKKSKHNSTSMPETCDKRVSGFEQTIEAESGPKHLTTSTTGAAVPARKRKKSKSKSFPIIGANERAAIIKEHIKSSESTVPCLLRRRVTKLKPIPLSEADKKAAARDELRKRKSKTERSHQRHDQQGKNVRMNIHKTETEYYSQNENTCQCSSDYMCDRLPHLTQLGTVQPLPKIPLPCDCEEYARAKQLHAKKTTDCSRSSSITTFPMKTSCLASQSDSYYDRLPRLPHPQTLLPLPWIPLTTQGEGYDATGANCHYVQQMDCQNAGQLHGMMENYGPKSQSETNHTRLLQATQPTAFSSLPKLQLTNDGYGYDATAWIKANGHLVKQICANQTSDGLKANSASAAMSAPPEMPLDPLNPDMNTNLSEHLMPEINSNPCIAGDENKMLQPASVLEHGFANNMGKSRSDSNRNRLPRLAQPQTVSLTKIPLTGNGARCDETAWLEANRHLLFPNQKCTCKNTAHSTELDETQATLTMKGSSQGMKMPRCLTADQTKHDKLNWPSLPPVGAHSLVSNAGRSQSDTNYVRLPQLPQLATILSLPQIPFTTGSEGYDATAWIRANCQPPNSETANLTQMTEPSDMPPPDTMPLPRLKLTSDGQGYDATAWIKEYNLLKKQISAKRAGGSCSKMGMSSSDKNSDRLPQIVKNNSDSLLPQMC